MSCEEIDFNNPYEFDKAMLELEEWQKIKSQLQAEFDKCITQRKKFEEVI